MYTKGEWRPCKADGDGCPCHMIWSIDNDCVVAVAIGAKDEDYTGGKGIISEAIIRANAQLIASAPDLYEACKMAQEGKGDWRGIIDLAITKAEGK